MKIFKSIWYIVLLALSIGFSSCEYDATNVDIPTIESKLVVQCFIAPQKSKTVAIVSTSQPIYGNNTGSGDVLDNATVEITNGTIKKKLTLVNNGLPQYEIDSSEFKIEAGQSYTLFVTVPDGREVNATCTVPFPVDGSTLTYDWDTIVKRDQMIGNIERTVRLSMRWKDNQQGPNFFRVGANVLVYSLDDTTKIFKERMSNNTFSDLYTDEGKDGGVFERNRLERTVFEQVGGSVNRFSFRPKGIEVYILNCDENYYRYHKTAENINFGDPFSEPALVFSNIIGGLGCFGATNQYIESINF